MSMAMTPSIATSSVPEEELFSGLMRQWSSPTANMGDIGILPGHAPLLTDLKPGPVRVTKQSGEQEVYYISGGFIEVQPNMVKVLADTAIRAGDLDEAAALEAQKAPRRRSTKKAPSSTTPPLQPVWPRLAQLAPFRSCARSSSQVHFPLRDVVRFAKGDAWLSRLLFSCLAWHLGSCEKSAGRIGAMTGMEARMAKHELPEAAWELIADLVSPNRRWGDLAVMTD